MFQRIRLHPVFLALLIVVTGTAAYLDRIPFLELVELKTIDLRFKSRGAVEPGPEVVIAAIDEKSLQKEGKWMWPRSKIAELIDRLSDAGAGVVAFDIGFLEPDDRRVYRAIDQIERQLATTNTTNDSVTDVLSSLKTDSDYDRRLTEAIGRSTTPVVLGYFFHFEPDATKRITQAELTEHEDNIMGSEIMFRSAPGGKAPVVPLARAPQSNITPISLATDYSGFFNMQPDDDGVVRWIPTAIQFNGSVYAPLSLSAISVYLDQAIFLSVDENGFAEDMHIGALNVPVDERGRILINYRGGIKTFPHISITDILRGNINPDTVRDKIVLVGATATGIYDLRVTPFSTVFPGVEVHANVIDSIIRQDFLYRPLWIESFDILAMLVLGLLLGLVLSRTGVLTGAISATAVLIGYIVLCQHLFNEKGWVLNMVYPLTVSGFTYSSITIIRYFNEARQKNFIRSAFSTYLAPAVVKQLIESPDKLNLGGEERVITAFFSDVQSFTSISEKLSPSELVDLLNEFLTEMTDIILTHEGTVDKFEGDAIIAFFGAPNDIVNQADVACRTCIDMQKRLVELREKWKTEGKPELKMRIGLCTGPAVVGNMGSRNRMDYTMMGDTVNTAARLEGVNKVYGTYTMISESTYTAAAGNGIVCREIDAINVVGKLEPIKVYQLVGYAGAVPDTTTEALSRYAEGLKLYRRRQWNEAICQFEQALQLTPDDGPSRTLLARCRRFIDHPPEDDWNGAFAMTSK